jgi:hypothetical protein
MFGFIKTKGKKREEYIAKWESDYPELFEEMQKNKKWAEEADMKYKVCARDDDRSYMYWEQVAKTYQVEFDRCEAELIRLGYEPEKYL